MKNLWRHAASAAAIASMAMGTVVGLSGPASAATDWIQGAGYLENTVCDKPNVTNERLADMGGQPPFSDQGIFLCGGGFNTIVPMVRINGVLHVFAIGTDRAVWVKYDGAWHTLDAIVGTGFVAYTYSNENGSLTLKITGTDGHTWYRTRNSGGGWTNWSR
ncbi:hypothetical protein OH807_37040 [Kitasatospora sp. NBC_01560]|uniref:hypothetical protein n=1 Tax=Kitasatospora sp. NBC_01560 TaxID=2975965 RepID=UPI003869E612